MKVLFENRKLIEASKNQKWQEEGRRLYLLEKIKGNWHTIKKFNKKSVIAFY